MNHNFSKSRRNFTLGLASFGALSACGGAQHPVNVPAQIDARVDVTLNHMFSQYPGTRQLAQNANGMLIMPLQTEIGFGFGASYGRGALRVNNQTVDYYSSASASAGLQIGAHQYAHVLFFMTQDALSNFRTSSGIALGANIEFAVLDQGDTVKAETLTSLSPVIAVVFAQAGFRLGATFEGTKYTRLVL